MMPTGHALASRSEERLHVAPLMVLIAWWLFCYLLYAGGWPIAYLQTNFFKVSVLLFAALVTLVIGYRLGIHRISAAPPTEAIPDHRRSTKLAVTGLVLLLALLVPSANAYSAQGISGLGAAYANQSAAYQQATERILEGTQARLVLVVCQTLAAPLTMLALPYFALQWFQYRRRLIPFLISLAVPLCMSILVGRDQQLGISVLSIAVVWLLSKNVRQERVRIKTLVPPLVFAIVVLWVIAERKLARTNGAVQCPPGSARCVAGIKRASLWDGVTQLVSSYASQGFEGLGRALDAAWHFGGGLSHSPALTSFFAGWVGSPDRHTVSAQLDNLGWSSTGYWSTAFAGVANDVPWLLVPLVYLLQGVLLGVAWKQAVERTDALSVAVATFTWISLFYTPQNLQLALSGPLYMGYLTLVIVFLVRSFGWSQRRRASSSLRSGSRYPRATLG